MADIGPTLDAYIYPVLTLPNEIISEIFIHFLPIYPRRPPIIGRLSPVVLGQICGRWRGIALSTPALWRAISLKPLYSNLGEKLHLLETYLERSGSCLLSIELESYHISGELTPFVEAIASHSARWEYLDLCMPRHYLRSFDSPPPFLHSLKLHTFKNTFMPADEVKDTLTSVFHAVPLLCYVALSFYATYYGPILPWLQLTTLTVKSIFPHECMQVLDRAVNLGHCNLRIFHPSTEPERYKHLCI
ncbi:hypothetical protein C8R44DRAFT_883171 [Mycena epipterygia]|nr:hypothetical protein C8R44DRAFT_883171 [Mycena epipterygia]